jgi:hypothetical protein
LLIIENGCRSHNAKWKMMREKVKRE